MNLLLSLASSLLSLRLENFVQQTPPKKRFPRKPLGASLCYSKLAENQNEYGLFITLSGYNSKVITFAEAKHNLRLIDGYELVDIVLEHYDELDTKYKNTIPLNKVFLPSVAK